MAFDLSYATRRKQDVLSVVLAVLSFGLGFLVPVALLATSGMHGGLRTFGVIEPRDVFATAIVVSVPTMGIATGLWYLYRSRTKSWREIALALILLLFHIMALYTVSRWEFFFWNVIL